MTIRKLIHLLEQFEPDQDAIVAFCDSSWCQVADVAPNARVSMSNAYPRRFNSGPAGERLAVRWQKRASGGGPERLARVS